MENNLLIMVMIGGLILFIYGCNYKDQAIMRIQNGTMKEANQSQKKDSRRGYALVMLGTAVFVIGLLQFTIKPNSDIPPESNYETNTNNTESETTTDYNTSSKTCSWCNESFDGQHYAHLGKMFPCHSTNDENSIGKYCSMKCCSDARRSSCPTCPD